MKKIILIFAILVSTLCAQTPTDSLQYLPRSQNPVLDEMKDMNKKLVEERQTVTDSIRERQHQEQERKNDARKRLYSSFSNVVKPASPDVFTSEFHFDPVRQYLTGTCWSFSTTSYFESEVFRLTGRKIKLSEMYTVYYDYLEMAKRFVRERGKSYFGQGAEGNAVMMIWQQYGIVPADAYKGELDADGRYDHNAMVDEMQGYLDYIKENDLWDEDLVVSSIRLIMDKYMGPPPKEFVFEGEKMTPPEFLQDVLTLKLDDYISVMSVMSKPFYEYGEYEVEMNWWRSQDYYNLPLHEFYDIIHHAITNGYTVRLNGDVSEPGYNGLQDAAVVPSFDIAAENIDQQSREFRIYNNSTTDDHDIHLVGHTRVGDFDWYLIKDSAATAQRGEFKGYLFYREDYIKLKMLTYIVHRDAVKAVVDQFK